MIEIQNELLPCHHWTLNAESRRSQHRDSRRRSRRESLKSAARLFASAEFIGWAFTPR